MFRTVTGFTIIEVVLVLAIAGLIFLMLFIALPMLQRSQRNTQREDDLARFLSSVVEYQSNNGSRTPFRTGATTAESVAQFINRYIDNTCNARSSSFLAGNITRPKPTNNACAAAQFRDPDGTIYRFSYLGNYNRATGSTGTASATSTVRVNADVQGAALHTIFVVSDAVCGTLEGTVTRGTGEHYVAMFMQLEGGSITCVTNGTRSDGPPDIDIVIADPGVG